MDSVEAAEYFSSLEPVDTEFMIGKWLGEGFPTGHAFDGLLEDYHWRGKHFNAENNVHPLVFNRRGGGIVSVNPAYMAAGLGSTTPSPLAQSKFAIGLFGFLLPILSTSKGRARLRMVEYEGQITAAMIYDQLPVIDVFKKVDENTVLGVMDNKNIPQPFYFKLIRECD